MEAIIKQRKELSANKESNIVLEGFINGEDLIYNLTRNKYESLLNQILIQFK